MKIIVFDISSHGFGHLAQTAPVIDRLCKRYSSLHVILRTQHPEHVVHEFVSSSIEIRSPPPEATTIAPHALTLDLDASADSYRRIHAEWDPLTAYEARRLAELRPAALVSNINPLSLAAAKYAGIPSAALCCMNWMDIFERYFGAAPGAEEIMEVQRDAYSSASVFLQPRPHMAMDNLPNRRSIGPIARRGERRDRELRALLGCETGEKIVLVTLGGLPNPLMLQLPRIDGVRWLLRRDLAPNRGDISAVEETKFPLIDLFFSVDAVVGKDSYGTVVESAHAGAGLVIVPRENWPETACFTGWAARHCNHALAPGGFDQAAILENAVISVLSGDPVPPVQMNGIDEAADAIATVSGLI